MAERLISFSTLWPFFTLLLLSLFCAISGEDESVPPSLFVYVSILSLSFYLFCAGVLGLAIPIKVRPSSWKAEDGIVYEAEKAFANVKEMECHLGIYNKELLILLLYLY
jgi:hypothetical protein